MIPPHSFLFFLILHVFQTSQILIPVNESFLGVGIENVTCAVDAHQWHISSQPEMPVVSQLHDATLSCSSSFDFFRYSGNLYFGVNANRSSIVFVNNDYWGAPPPTFTSQNALLLYSSDATAKNTTTMQDGKQQSATDGPLEQNGNMDTHSALSEHKIRRENPIELKVCEVTVEIVDLHVVPPDPFLDLVSSTLVEFLNPHFEKVICSYIFPYLGDFLEGAEFLVPLIPPTEKITGAIPLHNSSLFRSLVRLVHALPHPVPGATLRARFIDDTSLRISCTFEKGLQATYHSGDEKHWTVLRILFSAFMKRLPPFISELFSAENKSTVESWTTMFSSSNLSIILPSMRFLWAPETFLDLLFHTSLPPHSLLSMDINMKGFYWDENTYACRFSQNSGITISNIRIEGAGELGGTFTNVIFPIVTNQINEILDRILQSFPSVKLPLPSDPRKEEEEEEDSSSPDDSLYVSIPVKKPLVQQVPSVGILAGYVIISFIVCIAVVLRGLWMQVNHMLLSCYTLEPISRIRVVVEDSILSLGVCLCLGCFVWSNCTTAATVVLGEDLVVYRFSLRSTVVDLWAAGLNPLAFAVALFSGIYPYVKLIAVLYFTAWRCTPKASVLHALDCLGKLSLLDTFVMLIMVTGLTIHDVVDVVVFPPFYLFLVGTLGSIAMGSYATQCWRRNTILNARPPNTYPEGENDTVEQDEEKEEVQQEKEEKVCFTFRKLSSIDPSDLAPEANESENSVGSSEEGSPEAVSVSASMFRGLGECHLKHGVLMCVASLPVWCFPLVSYQVGGVGPLLTHERKTFNLYQLSASVDPVCLVVTLLTVLVAPCVYVISSSRTSWLASWCAADALVLACVAGLLQLNRFVEFVIGEDLAGVYTAHATLHLSLLPLFLASVYIWWLVVGSLFPWNRLGNPLVALQNRITQYEERSANAEETIDLLSP